MRRRLWWSLIIYDNRICEMSQSQTAMTPAWDCRTLHNINDSDVRPEMKGPPAVHNMPTDAIFAVVRSELSDFTRHSASHLDFTNPSLKSVAKDTKLAPIAEGGNFDALQKTIEEKYLKFANPENPLHFMTIWWTRAYLAKSRLWEHYSRYWSASVEQTDSQRDAAIPHVLSMLECDTKLMNSPLTKGYAWLIQSHFPAPAWLHIIQDLSKRPMQEYADKAWEVMSENWVAREMNDDKNNNVIFQSFSRSLAKAWEAREAASTPLVTPSLILDLRQRNPPRGSNAQYSTTEQQKDATGINMDDFSIPMPMDFSGHGQPYGMAGYGSASTGNGYPDTYGAATADVGNVNIDWTAYDWSRSDWPAAG